MCMDMLTSLYIDMCIDMLHRPCWQSVPSHLRHWTVHVAACVAIRVLGTDSCGPGLGLLPCRGSLCCCLRSHRRPLLTCCMLSPFGSTVYCTQYSTMHCMTNYIVPYNKVNCPIWYTRLHYRVQYSAAQYSTVQQHSKVQATVQSVQYPMQHSTVPCRVGVHGEPGASLSLCPFDNAALACFCDEPVFAMASSCTFSL